MKIVDLSSEFYAGMPKPKAHPDVALQYLLTPTEEEEARRGFTNKMELFTATTHVGTHVDAPSHFSFRGKNIDDYPPEIFFMVPTRKLDIPKGTYGVITVGDLEQAEQRTGPIRPDEIVLLNTGAYHRAASPDYLCSPYLTEQAAIWLADKKVRMVGIDSFTVDDPREKDKPAHRVLLNGHGILIIEGAAALDEVPPCFETVVLPLKIRHGSGAYARMIAVIKEEKP